MSLNFFKTKSQKTDATLQFSSVLNNLKTLDTSNAPLDIEYFIQKENIQLGEDLCNETRQNKSPPARIEVEKNYSEQDTRLFVNTLLDLSKSMPEAKSKAVECREQVKACLERNEATMNDINKMVYYA